MSDSTYIPNRLHSAGRELRLAFRQPSNELSHNAFIRAWCCIAYLFPGLHPDGYQDADSGWPRILRPFALQAWRRTEAGEMTDAELYPNDAAWSGLYDRMFPHKSEEIERRLRLAADHGECHNV